jgi:hypothetical protein
VAACGGVWSAAGAGCDVSGTELGLVGQPQQRSDVVGKISGYHNTNNNPDHGFSGSLGSVNVGVKLFG